MAFAAAAGVVLVALVGGLVVDKLAAVASMATLVTFVMVFAVQHTANRESRALNVKLDALIRVTSARPVTGASRCRLRRGAIRRSAPSPGASYSRSRLAR